MPETRKAPPWLVRELVALGVPEEKALGYGWRQAFAVRNSMQRRARGDKSAALPQRVRPEGGGVAEGVDEGGTDTGGRG